MPSDKRSSAAGDLTGWNADAGLTLDDALVQLTESEIIVEGRLPWSSNMTFLVTIDRGPLRAVYKPARGERALWDFPGGLFRREVAAYALSESLGWALVPPTVARTDGPFGAGSLQLFVDADYRQHYFTLFESGEFDGRLRTISAFDVVANNADRKSGHVLCTDDGRLWGIDHGLCFHDEPKLRTVIWDFAGDEIPEPLLTDLEGLVPDLPDDLARFLTGAERDQLVSRIRKLVATGVFPEPEDTDHSPYPWPLV
ncbi:MAG: SCO1664 family protein [Acidimicrobiales bacterium]